MCSEIFLTSSLINYIYGIKIKRPHELNCIHHYVHWPPILWNHLKSANVLTHMWWNSVVISIGSLWQYIKDLSRPSDKVVSWTIHFVLTCSGFFLEILIAPIVPKAVRRICFDHIQLLTVVVWKLPFQPKCQLCQPIYIWLVIVKIWFSWVMDILRGKCRELPGVSKGATWKVVRWIREKIEDDHIKRRPRSSLYHEGKQVSLSVHDQAGTDQANWHMCPVCHFGWLPLYCSRVLQLRERWCGHISTHFHTI